MSMANPRAQPVAPKGGWRRKFARIEYLNHRLHQLNLVDGRLREKMEANAIKRQEMTRLRDLLQAEASAEQGSESTS